MHIGIEIKKNNMEIDRFFCFFIVKKFLFSVQLQLDSKNILNSAYKLSAIKLNTNFSQQPL